MSLYPVLSEEQCSALAIDFIQRNGEMNTAELSGNIDVLDSQARANIEETVDRVSELYFDFEGQGRSINADFDALASALLHEDLAISPGVASDSGFWRWLAFYEDGALARIVQARFGDGTNAKHFGVGGGLDDCYLKMLWFRANSVYLRDSEYDDGYELARFGGAELWRSHILRQNYAQTVNLVRALVRIVQEYSILTGDRKTADARLGIRDLAPEIKRQSANLAIELMTEEEAYQFLDGLIQSAPDWCGKSL